MDNNEDIFEEMKKAAIERQKASSTNANSKNTENSNKKKTIEKPKKTIKEKKYKKVEKKEKNEVKSTKKDESKWKKATVSRPSKKTKRILTVLAALSVSALVIFSAHKGNIKLPDFTIPTFQTSVTELDTNSLTNSNENQNVDENYSIFTDEQAEEIAETVEEQQKNEEIAETSPETGQENEIEEMTFKDLQKYLVENYNININEGNFENSLVGSTGVCGNVKITFENMMNNSNEQVTLNSGETCTILGITEDETEFVILTQDGKLGKASTDKLWVNASDVIPSIIYNVLNDKSAQYQARDEDIPGVTGEKLYSSSEDESLNYDCYQYNEKLGRNEYIVPVTYQMAKKLGEIQKDALSQGYSLVIYETFRPWATQEAVKDGLSNMFGNDDDRLMYELNKGYGTSYGKSWFIAQKSGKHQYGIAMDCGLAKVNNLETGISGDHEYTYFKEGDYEILEMPSDIHELSAKAAVYKYGVNSESTSAWKNNELTGGWTEGFANNENAQLLQKLCTDHGLTPLSSEWWHFNDLDSWKTQKNLVNQYMEEHPEDKNYKAGNFAIGDCKSIGDISKIMEELEEYKEANLENSENPIENNIDYDR